MPPANEGRWYVFVLDEGRELWQVRKTEGRYPNWRQLLPDTDKWEVELRLPREPLVSAVEASKVIAERNAPMRLVVNGNVRATVVQPDTAQFEETIDGATVEYLTDAARELHATRRRGVRVQPRLPRRLREDDRGERLGHPRADDHPAPARAHGRRRRPRAAHAYQDQRLMVEHARLGEWLVLEARAGPGRSSDPRVERMNELEARLDLDGPSNDARSTRPLSCSWTRSRPPTDLLMPVRGNDRLSLPGGIEANEGR
jgi:hypothetical protein